MYRQILVGTDGSTTASRAVDRAAALAGSVGAALTIACAGRPEKAAAVLEREADRLSGAGLEVHTKVLDGDPADALVAESENGYDLLVVGNKGMTGLGRFLVGSVPDKVSHHAPCALLIVHTT